MIWFPSYCPTLVGGVDLENEELFTLAGNNGSCCVDVK